MGAPNDYLCETCGHYGEYLAGPDCRPQHCGHAMVWAPSRPPAVDNYDTRAYEVSHNGQTHRIDSIGKLRAVERLTEQQSRNGEGTPIVWRDYSQTRSNTDRHTLTRDLTAPMDGYADGTTGVSSQFAKRVGAAVAADHGAP